MTMSVRFPEGIASLIDQIPYDYYVETLFHAEAGSIWDQQMQWTGPKPNAGRINSVAELALRLPTKMRSISKKPLDPLL